MPKERSGSDKGNGGKAASRRDIPRGERELIVVVKPEAGLRATSEGVASVRGANVSPLAEILSARGASLEPLFGLSEERIDQRAAAFAPASSAGYSQSPTLSLFYHVAAPDDQLEALASELLEQDLVESAYVKPPAELAQAASQLAGDPPFDLNSMAPLAADAPPISPDFVLRQSYLDAAPTGVDARYAWTEAGGGGAGVRVIDLEWGWRFTHEDLTQNQGGIVGGVGSASTDHGTAVLGVISGDRNTFGITGIAPDAHVSAVAFSMPTAAAIRLAADRLRPGDVMLLEIHRPGPRFGFAARSDQRGYVAVEWWPDDWAAIRYATNRGVIVVEAAGNGAENLDDVLYSTRPAGFPATWTNPFNRANPQCGAIVVGAGNPPPGTHGRNAQPATGEAYVDRARCGFSNYGALIDAQGWGWEVTTAGYGDLQGGTNQDLWYTDQFSGTSSASPCVVGALACVQGHLHARGRIPLSAARARELLRSTGSPQQAAPGRPVTQRIGNRPNLRQLLSAVRATSAPWVGVQFRGTIPAGRTLRWFTFNWPAHWHVLWTVVPTSITPGGPQIKWAVQVERASDQFITYWIEITNLGSAAASIEARYAVLGW